MIFYAMGGHLIWPDMCQIIWPPTPERVKEASIVVGSERGNSRGGRVPVVPVYEDTKIYELALDLEQGWDEAGEVFVFINKEFIGSALLSKDGTHFSPDLKGRMLMPGVYHVEAVQFAGGDMSTSVVTYGNCKYEVELAE